MQQICYTEIPDKWTKFEDILGNNFSADVTYSIQNTGDREIIVQENGSFPKNGGTVIPIFGFYSYKKENSDLYIKSSYKIGKINITGVTTMSSEVKLGTLTVTTNGTYAASDENFDGYSKVIVNVDNTPVVSGTYHFTRLETANISAYQYADIQDANLVPENIKKDTDILGIVGTYDPIVECDHSITATNNSTYDRYTGEKVWLKKVNDNYEVIDFIDADSDTYTGTLLSDALIGEHCEVKTFVDGIKTPHSFTLDYSDYGNPLPIINDDDHTVTFNTLGQSIEKHRNNMPTPTESVEIVVKAKFNGTGERGFTDTGAYFFQGETTSYTLTPFIRIYFGEKVSINYDGLSFGEPNGSYDVIPEEEYDGNKFYWIKVLYKNNAMTFYVSEDGISWTYIWSKQFNVDIFEQFTSNRNRFALLPFKNGDTVGGIYDLVESHVKIDDIMVMQSYRPIDETC